MSTKLRLLSASLVCLTVFYAPASSALIQWWSDGASCGSGYGNSCSKGAGMDASGPTMTATAWANTGGASNDQLQNAQINRYSGGFGVTNRDHDNGDDREGSTPEHAMDNDDRFDMILFDFQGLQISLEQVYVGWHGNNHQYDTDISVLAYTGDGPLDLDSRQVDGSNEDLTSNGWEIVGNYDVDDNSDGSGDTAYIQGHDSNGDGIDDYGNAVVSSSYWLIGAYNPVFASAGCEPTANWCNGPETSYPDYMKIKDLAGSIIDTPPPPTSVPEPGSLLLLASALFLTPRLRRQRQG